MFARFVPFRSIAACRAPVTNSLGTILNDDPESVSLWESKLPPTEDVRPLTLQGTAVASEIRA